MKIRQAYLLAAFFLVKHRLVSSCDHITIFQFFYDSNQQQHKILSFHVFENIMDNNAIGPDSSRLDRMENFLRRYIDMCSSLNLSTMNETIIFINQLSYRIHCRFNSSFRIKAQLRILPIWIED